MFASSEIFHDYPLAGYPIAVHISITHGEPMDTVGVTGDCTGCVQAHSKHPSSLGSCSRTFLASVTAFSCDRIV